MDLIEPKDFVVKTQGGLEKTFILSKIPYMSGGREICSQFITTAMPKIGNYPMNEDLAKKMFSFVGVKTDGGVVRLLTADLINNHVPDFQTGARLEKEMLEYNFGFFDPEKISAFQKALGQKLQGLIMPILTQLQAQLSKKDAPHSMN